jgi:N-formylglutamate deformylase
MLDQAFLEALESCRLPPSAFGHEGHVRAAYLWLRSGTLGEAIDRVGSAIRRYAAAQGRAGRYHETITLAYVLLIRRHLHERGDGGGWDGFRAANPELFERDLLLRWYGRDELAAPLARRVFVLPERRAGPSAA